MKEKWVRLYANVAKSFEAFEERAVFSAFVQTLSLFEISGRTVFLENSPTLYTEFLATMQDVLEEGVELIPWDAIPASVLKDPNKPETKEQVSPYRRFKRR